MQSYVPFRSSDAKEFEVDSEFESTGIQTEIENSLVSPLIYKLSNPLVALLCIGKYCKENEDGIKFNDITAKSQKDYINSKYCFNYKLGYSIIYMIGDNNNDNNTNLRHLRKGVDSGKKVKDNLKLEWNEEEIEDFNEQIKKSITN